MALVCFCAEFSPREFSLGADLAPSFKMDDPEDFQNGVLEFGGAKLGSLSCCIILDCLGLEILFRFLAPMMQYIL
jgi:hypothetical protein